MSKNDEVEEGSGNVFADLGLPDAEELQGLAEVAYFLTKVEKGLRQADAGRTMSHENARRRILD